MTPTETLVHEHEVILMVVEAAAREAEAIGVHGEVDTQRVARMADSFAGFADHCHHAKEEKILFPRLEERGALDKGCPIEQLRDEHERGREHVKAIRAALGAAPDADRAARIARHLADYAGMLREHIRRENKILFPCADHNLTREDRAELEKAFDKVEAEEMGPGVHEQYHRLAHELAARTVPEA